MHSYTEAPVNSVPLDIRTRNFKCILYHLILSSWLGPDDMVGASSNRTASINYTDKMSVLDKQILDICSAKSLNLLPSKLLLCS